MNNKIPILLFTAILLFFIILLKIRQMNAQPSPSQSSVTSAQVRPAAFAGQFYPDHSDRLSSQINDFLSAVGTPLEPKASIGALPLPKAPRWSDVTSDPSGPQILLVPHAGIDFSGQTAAHAYSTIKDSKIKNVILLGPSHHALFSGIAIDNSQFWQTPLGRVAINQSLAKKLVSAPQITFNTSAHRQEHCLEVQLPFLQTVLKDFTIIPILIGQTDQPTLDLLAQKITPLLNDSTILIISSDLSHYPNQSTAQIVDQKTIDAVLSVDPSVFDTTMSSLRQQYSAIDTFACGHQAIKVGLTIAHNLDLEAQLLDYTNSGHITGQPDRVVGYAAIAFYHSNPATPAPPAPQRPGPLPGAGVSPDQLNAPDQKTLLNWSRKVLTTYIENQETPDDPSPSPSFDQKRGVFVTLHQNDQLRGCIGNFEADQSVWQQVADMTVSAATKDPRFPIVTANQLSDITVEISILSPLKQISSYQDIDLSSHGVYLDYRGQTGTFLPQVATETGWSKEEFLGQLCSQKMGLSSDCYLDPDIKIFVYTAQVFSPK